MTIKIKQRLGLYYCGSFPPPFSSAAFKVQFTKCIDNQTFKSREEGCVPWSSHWEYFLVAIAFQAAASRNKNTCKERWRVCEQFTEIGRSVAAVHSNGLLFSSPAHFLVSFSR